MGFEGETGVRMIKEKLGMDMVQVPRSHNVNHDLYNQNQFQKILIIIRANCGHDFTLYKRNTLKRRMERRIAFHQLEDFAQYVDYLRENPAEIDLLSNELLIGVTKFFRDGAAFESLKTQMVERFEKKKSNNPLRIWIAGCSTGEEAYSVAILALEYLDSLTLKTKPKLQIFATDLDGNAVAHARTGFYFKNIASDVSPQRLERFFVEKDEGYVVKKEVRDVIIFTQHNLIKDAPFNKLDLICCRNVMIYFTAELQKKIIPLFHYSLRERGLLFLGPAESLSIFNEGFISHDTKWKIWEKKEGSLLHEIKIKNQSFTATCDARWKTNKFEPLLLDYNRGEIDAQVQQDLSGQSSQFLTVCLRPLNESGEPLTMIVTILK